MELRYSQASIALDFMRAFAAQAVCVGHTIGLFGVALWAQPPYVPYMQNVAVLVFFLLSGFLIAHTLATRSRDPSYGFGAYFVDRFSRIYSAFVPALLVIAFIDIARTSLSGEVLHTLTVKAFIGNLLMLQDAPKAVAKNVLGHALDPAYNVPSFGSAGQLWTLAIEWHIYMLAGALFFIRRSMWIPILAMLFLAVPLTYLRGVRGQDFGHGVTAMWIVGFATYYAMPRLMKLPAWFMVGICAFGVAAYFVLVIPGDEYKRATYPLLIAAFVAAVCLAGRMEARPEGGGARVIRFMAAYSFTLYLVHNSMVKAMAKLWNGDPIVAVAISIIAANALAIAVAIPTEMRHREISAFLSRCLKAFLEQLRPGMRATRL